MMIGTKEFYFNEPTGKSREQILRETAKLKRYISKLKRTMEHPDYTPSSQPTEETQLGYARLYLEKAKEALATLGEEYKPTLAESRIAAFDENIGNIKKITLIIEREFDGLYKYAVELDGEPQFLYNSEPYVTTRETFLEAFRELHIGEWRKNYDTAQYGYSVTDGVQWSLTVEYNNRHRDFFSGGTNAYPYNFNELTKLLGSNADTEGK